MLQSLAKRWKVSGKDLFFILCAFAITGLTTAYLTKTIIAWTGISSSTHWTVKLLVRLGVLIFGYQVILLIVAFLLGQFPFFWRYEKKILRRLGLMKKEQTKSSAIKEKQLIDERH